MEIQKTDLKRPMDWLMASALGMGAMYVLDPERGHRRRAVMRDQIHHWNRQTRHSADVVSRDILHRTYGIVAMIRGLFSRAEVSDDILIARLRSKLGRIVSNPHSIEVLSNRGHVILKGGILDNELDRLISSLSKVKGLKSLQHHLEIHTPAENIAGLQGRREKDLHRSQSSFDVLQTNWSPATRTVMGLMGIVSVIYGYKNRKTPGLLLSGLGATVLLRSLSNRQIKELTLDRLSDKTAA